MNIDSKDQKAMPMDYMKLELAAREVIRQHSMECLSDKTVDALRDALAEPELNLNCKSVQKRLATVWGYVKAEQAEHEPVAYKYKENSPETGEFVFAKQAECKECGAKQAQIDRLMLEYCPDEMTPEQMLEWGNNQRPAEQTEQEPEVWYCPDCGTLSELQVKCCPDWIRSRKVPKNFALTCKATFDRNVQTEQEPFDMNDHPPHRLCECRKCMEYFTPLPDCDAFAASGKPIAEQTNTQLMEGFRPVSEMIAEHKQDPKKAAAIEKAKMRKAEQKPVAVVEITYGREPECYVTGNIDDFPEGVFKLYAAPVRTKDMTNEDKLALWKKWNMTAAQIDAVIAAYKEKNK